MRQSRHSPMAVNGRLYGELIESARAAASVDAVHGLCGRICREAGFDHFIYGAVLPTSLVQPQTLIISGYPPDWWACYQEKDYFGVDPVVQHTVSQQSVPLIWEDLRLGQTEDQSRRLAIREFMNDAADHGLVTGVSFPAQIRKGGCGVLSLVSREQPGKCRERVRDSLAMGQLMAGFVHEAALRCLSDGELMLNGPTLTDRERECLLWAAEGKTNAEIGMILQISTRTVIFHLNNAAEKMGVRSRAQTVARAISLGHITPQF